jgi:hypothetical protein
VPLYPVLPLVFTLTSGAMLVSAILYVGAGAWFGIAVLAVGAMLLVWLRPGRQGP